jgi:hypothetical protein
MDWAQLNRSHLMTEAKSSLQNVVFLTDFWLFAIENTSNRAKSSHVKTLNQYYDESTVRNQYVHPRPQKRTLRIIRNISKRKAIPVTGREGL